MGKNLTKNYKTDFKQEITSKITYAIKRNLSISLFGIYQDGRSTFFNYLASNKDLHTSYPTLKLVKWLYINCGHITGDDDAVIQVLNWTVDSHPSQSYNYFQLIDLFSTMAQDQPVVIILDDIHPQIPNQFWQLLKQVRTQTNGKISFIFALNHPDEVTSLGPLVSVALEQQLYFGMYSEIDTLATFGVRDQQTILQQEIDIRTLVQYTGGHPGLMKLAINQWPGASAQLSDWYKIPGVEPMCQHILDTLHYKLRQALLQHFVNAGNQRGVASDLLQVYQLTDPQGQLFSPIFKYYFSQSLSDITIKVGQIYLNQQDITHIFTQSEARVFALLNSQIGTSVSRDDIGRAMWGKKFTQKYSDWAIDKLISKLRSKLQPLPFEINTISKVGYQLQKKAYLSN